MPDASPTVSPPRDLTVATAPPERGPQPRFTRLDLAAAVPGLLVVGLMLVWAIHDGGYDEDTWYWGALAALALTVGTVIALGTRRLRPSRPAAVSVALFGLYVAWSYSSIIWAQYRGAALEGSNKTLLYLLVFVLFALIPWTARTMCVALLTFAVGIGATAIVLLTRLASGSNVSALFVGGRLAAPTGYINSTAALFTMGALVCISLAVRRELWGPVRGLLLAFAAAELDLAITVQSRGWLFTLPIVGLLAIIVSPNRLRVTAAAILPVIGAALSARSLLRVLEDTTTSTAPLRQLAQHAGRPALLACCAIFAVGTFAAWADSFHPVTLGRWTRRITGTVLIIGSLAGGFAVALVVSNGHPASFVSNQFNGFAHQETDYSGSHFANVGSGRFDFWRVALRAFETHPVGGLGQGSFGDYYLLHRHTSEEPTSPHSLELQLLSETGLVGFLLFAGVLVFAFVAARRSRRRGSDLGRAMSAVALMPVIVWLAHGSVDWFWDMPALSGPALGFFAMAGANVETRPVTAPPVGHTRNGIPRLALGAVAAVAVLASVVVLAFSYLSVQEVSIATNIQNSDPTRALADLRTAGKLNPLDSNPGLVAGAVALRNDDLVMARSSLRQSTDREPGDWLAWLLAGVTAYEQGDRQAARLDYLRADAIDSTQLADREALARINSRRPLTSAAVFKLLIAVN